MPEKMERNLKARARKKFPKDEERQDRYVYGTMRKSGWKPSREKRSPKAGNILTLQDVGVC